MANRFSALGVKDVDVKFARAFERQARKAGWPSQRINSVIEQVARNERYGSMPTQEAWAQFQSDMGDKLGRAQFDMLAEVHDKMFVLQGPEALMPSHTDAEKRLREIRELRRSDPDKYEIDDWPVPIGELKRMTQHSSVTPSFTRSGCLVDAMIPNVPALPPMDVSTHVIEKIREDIAWLCDKPFMVWGSKGSCRPGVIVWVQKECTLALANIENVTSPRCSSGC